MAGDRVAHDNYGPIQPAVERADEEIQDEVRNRLTWNNWVDADRVHVSVRDRVVTLTGAVDSVVEKRAAGDDAWATPGVREGVNDLRVPLPEAATGR